MRIVAFILILCCHFTVSAGDWELEKDKEGIKVYTKRTSGSDIKDFKVEAVMKAPRLKIAKIVSRAGDYMNWIPNVDESRVLKVVSSTKRVAYYVVDCPWPTSNRDIVMDFWVETDKANRITYVKFKENLTAKPEVDGMVRMKRTTGYWKLTSLTENKTKVYYEFSGDPGGNLPAWLINMFIVDTPFDTFVALKEKVE